MPKRRKLGEQFNWYNKEMLFAIALNIAENIPQNRSQLYPIVKELDSFYSKKLKKDRIYLLKNMVFFII